MIILLSPTKTWRSETPSDIENRTQKKMHTSFYFPEKTAQLISWLKGLSSDEIQTFMKVSPAIAEQNKKRFSSLSIETPLDASSRLTLFSFHGEAYDALHPESLSDTEISWLDQHLRIPCGLYGLLKPFHGILPYRLEMQQKASSLPQKNLYAFWGSLIAGEIKVALEEQALLNRTSENPPLIDLASLEYSKTIVPFIRKAMPEQLIIQPRFESQTQTGWKVVSFDAKRARGLLTRHLSQQMAVNSTLSLQKHFESFQLEGWALSTWDAKSPLFRKNTPES